MFNYESAYLFAGIFYGLIWIYFFATRKDNRNQMIVISLFILALAPINVIWHGDYWKPPYVFGELFRFEDYLWGFAFGGVVSVSYETFFRKKLVAIKNRSRKREIIDLLVILSIIFSSMIILTSMMGINSIYSVSFSLLLITGYIIANRRDLIPNIFWSGVIATVIIFIFYIIWQYLYPGVFELYWKLPAMSNIFIYGIPIEELVWFFLAGMAIGPLDEFLFGFKTVKNH